MGGPQQWTTANINSLLASSALFVSAGTIGIDTSGGNFSETNLTGSGLGLVKLGPNTLTLTGTNSYAGGTLVSGGALEVDNHQRSAGAFTSGKVSVASGATLTLAVGGSQQWTSANVSNLLAVSGSVQPQRQPWPRHQRRQLQSRIDRQQQHRADGRRQQQPDADGQQRLLGRHEHRPRHFAVGQFGRTRQQHGRDQRQ